MDDSKMKEFKELIDPLYDKIDNEEMLNPDEQMAMDLYLWLSGDGDKPSLD